MKPDNPRLRMLNHLCEQAKIDPPTIPMILYLTKKITEDHILEVLQWYPEDVRVKIIKEYVR